MSSAEKVLDACGITYRQLDHWVRKGYLQPRDARVTSGRNGRARDFTDDELAVAARMARLVDRGFTPFAAAKIARRTESVIALGQGITLTISEDTP